MVPADDCTVATLQSLLCPFINCCSRLKREHGSGLARNKHLEDAVFDKQLSKTIGVVAIVCIGAIDEVTVRDVV